MNLASELGENNNSARILSADKQKYCRKRCPDPKTKMATDEYGENTCQFLCAEGEMLVNIAGEDVCEKECPAGWVNQNAQGASVTLEGEIETFFSDKTCVPACGKGYFNQNGTCKSLCGVTPEAGEIVNPMLNSQDGGVDCRGYKNIYVEFCDYQSILETTSIMTSIGIEKEEKICKTICGEHQVLNLYYNPFENSPKCLSVCDKDEIVNPMFFTKFNADTFAPEDTVDDLKTSMTEHEMCIPKELICPRGYYKNFDNGQYTCKQKCKDGQIRLPGFADLKLVSKVSECAYQCGKGSVRIVSEYEEDGEKKEEVRCESICDLGFINPYYNVEENDIEQFCIADLPVSVDSWNELGDLETEDTDSMRDEDLTDDQFYVNSSSETDLNQDYDNPESAEEIDTRQSESYQFESD